MGLEGRIVNKKLKEHLEQKQINAQAELDKWVKTYQTNSGIAKRVAEYEIKHWTTVLKEIDKELTNDTNT